MASHCSEIRSTELYSLSFDSVEEDTDHPPWYSLIQNLSFDDLQTLKDIFKRSDQEQTLGREEFLDAIASIYKNSKYSLQSLILFDEIRAGEKERIGWTDLVGFLSTHLAPEPPRALLLAVGDIVAESHTKRETIVKIVPIETEEYFCYAVVSKHGKVGIYDGNLNFLTTYQSIMTREDISRKEEDRRRRNRWVTDAVFLRDVLMFALTNTARTIVIYDASGLNHVPLWLVLSSPNIVQSFAYKSFSDDEECQESTLFMGDACGQVSAFVFHKPKASLLRKKHSDKINLFYWEELPGEKEFVTLKHYKRIHKESIHRLKYLPTNNTLMSCSRDPNASVVVKYLRNQNSRSLIFKMKRGCRCFALSNLHKILITGSDDGLLRIWNSVINAKPVAILLGHDSGIVDLQVLENQHLFISSSRDGVLKLWDIKEQKCIQTLKIKFPSFGVLGKLIEWGIESIYPGPKRFLVPGEEDSEGRNLDLWERSTILVACCNYIASVNLLFGEMEVQKTFDQKVLPPPPLQNSVLIPKSWDIFDDKDEEADGSGDQDGHLDGQEEFSKEAIRKHLDELSFILDRDLLAERGLKHDINFKIANLELKKAEMMKHVERGAPYLALDLYDVEDLKLTPNLFVPNRKKTRTLVDSVEKMLEGANYRDLVFSDPSSSRSPRSSRSSVVEFEY